MTIDIHPSALSRVIDFLRENLPKIEVYNGVMLNRSSLIHIAGIDEILDRKVASQAAIFIDENPLFDFTVDYLDRLLEENLEWSREPTPVSITEAKKLPNSDDIANNILSNFISLPSNYLLTIDYPNKLLDHLPDEKEIILSNDIKIISPTSELRSLVPRITGNSDRDRASHGLSLLFLGEPQAYDWNDAARYIIISKVGHISRFGDTLTSQSAVSQLKSFYGLGLALRLFAKKHVYSPSPRTIRVITHRRIADKWEIQNSFEIPPDVSHAIDSLDYESWIKGDPNTANIHVSRELKSIRNVFSNDNNERILLACSWFFDSHVGQNELLSFIQVMIALEILLGDKAASDAVGLNELLSNRCAYLIGKSQSQRDELLKEFREIYDIRSQIVHRGKSRLSIKERRLWWKLTWMCGRVIQEEVRLAAANEKAGSA